ncbi:hypothetical protein [Vibrio owensii]|uniref:hypothetical protein n=1 Tax=Vibrio owensii TaxID=696485 RepID=UPI00406896AF
MFRIPLLIIALTSFNVSASNLIICNDIRIKHGDTYDKVRKANCGTNVGNTSGSKLIDGKRLSHKTLKIKLNDGSNAAFVFINNQLIEVIVFD